MFIRKWFAWDETLWSPFGSQEVKSNEFALAERSLVHFRALKLEDYAAFLRSRSEHTFIVQSHYVSTPSNHATAHSILSKDSVIVLF